jgi:hypothetical protein
MNTVSPAPQIMLLYNNAYVKIISFFLTKLNEFRNDEEHAPKVRREIPTFPEDPISSLKHFNL